MHEMSLLRDAVDIVLESVEGSDIAAVTKVTLAIGDMRDVVEEYVPGLFERLTRGTVAEGSEVQIIHVPITMRCNECGFAFPIDLNDESTWKCPGCGAFKQFRLVNGNEFMVKSIEVESPAVKPSEERVAS